MTRLLVVIASTRPGRIGPEIAEWFVRRAKDHAGYQVDTADLAELDLPFLDEPHHPSERRYTKPHTREWSATVDAADAVVFVMPEYNNSFSAPLKNAIDYLYHEWSYKPVSFVSYGGVSAGTRAVVALKPVLANLRMLSLNEAVNVPLRQTVVDGRFTPTESLDAAADGVLNELQRVAAALTTLRERAA